MALRRSPSIFPPYPLPLEGALGEPLSPTMPDMKQHRTNYQTLTVFPKCCRRTTAKENTMIDSYSAQIIARQEHELMHRSLAPVSDYAVPENANQGGWAAKQVSRLLGSVSTALTAVALRLDDWRTSMLDG